MKRWIMLFLVCVAWIGMLDVSTGLSQERKHKILIINSQDAEPYTTLKKSLLDSLEKMGYIPDKNLDVTYYSMAHYVGRSKSIWAREKDAGHGVIVVNGTMAAIAFKDRVFGDMNHNVVFCAVTDPVDVGVIDNFTDPPKANFTGVSYPIPIKKRFEFIRKVMPQAKNIGYIYADMPQSHSYKRWIENLIQNDPEFQNMKLISRKVEFIKADKGSKRMALEARQYIVELNPLVDVFLSPSDQLGTQAPYSNMVAEHGTKPLVGIAGDDVLQGWGATMTIYTSLESMANQAAVMVDRLFKGESIQNIIPEQPKDLQVAFDMKKVEKFGLKIPEELIQMAGKNVIR